MSVDSILTDRHAVNAVSGALYSITDAREALENHEGGLSDKQVDLFIENNINCLKSMGCPWVDCIEAILSQQSAGKL